MFFNISTTFQFLTFFMSLLTAHYVFDPDYISENEIAEEMLMDRKESRSKLIRRAMSKHSLITAEKSEAHEPANPQAGREQYNFAERVLRFTKSALGDEKDPVPDRIGRRYVVPLFLILMLILPFVPRNGPRSPIRHPMAGTSSALFKVTLPFLLLYLAIFIVLVSLERAGYKAAGTQHEGSPESNTSLWEHHFTAGPHLISSNVSSGAASDSCTRRRSYEPRV